MPASSQTIIKPTIPVVTINVPFPVIKSMLPGTLSATNLATTEKVTVSFSHDGGKTFEAAKDGAAVELTATKNQLSINSPVYMGITKSATVAACGVFFD